MDEITYRWEGLRTNPLMIEITQWMAEKNGAGGGFVNFIARRMDTEGNSRYTIIFENGSDDHLEFVETYLGQLTLVEGWD